jgi:hypothetical protein
MTIISERVGDRYHRRINPQSMIRDGSEYDHQNAPFYRQIADWPSDSDNEHSMVECLNVGRRSIPIIVGTWSMMANVDRRETVSLVRDRQGIRQVIGSAGALSSWQRVRWRPRSI